MPAPHILITRPQPQADELSEVLKADGFETIVLPAFRFRPVAVEELPAGMGPDSPGRRMFVFTSPRSVEYGLRHIPESTLPGCTIAAISGATAKRLSAEGIEADLVPLEGFTSEDFLKQPALVEDPGTAVLVNAPDGRGELAKGLRSSGWQVTDWHVYEIVPAVVDSQTVDAIRSAEQLWTIWTSLRAMELVAALLPRDAWNRVRAGQWFVPSPRLENASKRVGVLTTSRLDGPGNRDIRASLKKALSQ